MTPVSSKYIKSSLPLPLQTVLYIHQTHAPLMIVRSCIARTCTCTYADARPLFPFSLTTSTTAAHTGGQVSILQLRTSQLALGTRSEYIYIYHYCYNTISLVRALHSVLQYMHVILLVFLLSSILTSSHCLS
jgi:hypothetical protein